MLAGRTPACKWVRLACERHRADLARSRSRDYPYKFDPGPAERVCRFVELLPHTKGKWAAQGALMRLEGWQCFILTTVFGWVHKTSGLRRFRSVLLLIPRKNGKSALSAPVGLYMLAADKEHGAEVYAGATSEKQAQEVFRPARQMAQATPELRQHFGIEVSANTIHVLRNGSRMEAMIGKPGDGASPSCAIIDEYHEHDTPEQNDTMLTGMGARGQPLLWRITTAGSNLAGPCFDEVLTGRKILDGVIQDDTVFYVEYTIDEGDDWTAPEALRKANPNFGISIEPDFLIGMQRAAIRNPRDQNRFKTKHLNQWVNARAAYFNAASWTACFDRNLTREGLHGRRCVIGMDLASKNDIAALQLLFDMGDGTYATFGHYYLPEDALDQPGTEHYRAWAIADPAHLTLTEGNMIDFDRIAGDIDDLRRLYQVDLITFDPAQATMLVTQLMAKGIEVKQFDQNARNFSEPMKQVAALMDGGKLRHDCDGSHPMTWMISNVTARLDAKDQVYPRKERPENKIDGPVALIMAMGACMTGETQFRSQYDAPGSTGLFFV